MNAEAPAEITRAELDWVCITQRAAENNPTSQLLWVQASLAMSDAIQGFNAAALDQAHAAHAQYLLNRIAAFALKPVNAPTISGAPVPLVTEHMKDQLMHIASRGYDARSLL